MSSAIAKTSTVTNSFRWLSGDGTKKRPAQMDTRHLFFTLRMIWNHSAPEPLKLHPFKRYKFNRRTYTDEYMLTAVRVMLHELRKRRDKLPAWERQIEHMERSLSSNKIIAMSAAYGNPSPRKMLT